MFQSYYGLSNRTAGHCAGSDLYSGVAQLAERRAVNTMVAGSNPAPGANMASMSRMLAVPMLKRTGALNAGSFA